MGHMGSHLRGRSSKDSRGSREQHSPTHLLGLCPDLVRKPIFVLRNSNSTKTPSLHLSHSEPQTLSDGTTSTLHTVNLEDWEEPGLRGGLHSYLTTTWKSYTFPSALARRVCQAPACAHYSETCRQLPFSAHSSLPLLHCSLPTWHSQAQVNPAVPSV